MTELNRTEQDAVLGSEWKEVLCDTFASFDINRRLGFDFVFVPCDVLL